LPSFSKKRTLEDMDIVQISVEPRQGLGKNAARAIRNEGKIPGVIYSKANGVTHFTTQLADVKSMVFTPDFKLAEISINGAVHKALLKEVVFHPVTDEIVHMDFLELIEGQPLKANIPVKFEGVSPGVKSGGKLIKTLRTVKVKTTPESLVDTLFVNIDQLELGAAVRVRDIEVPDGVEIMVEGAVPVANVEVPRALRSEEDSEGEVEVAEVEAETE